MTNKQTTTQTTRRRPKPEPSRKAAGGGMNIIVMVSYAGAAPCLDLLKQHVRKDLEKKRDSR